MLASVRPGSHSNGELPVCLWKEKLYSPVSWWDVEQFSAETLHTWVCVLEKLWAAFGLTQQKDLSESEKEAVCRSLRTIESTLRSSGLPTSAEAASEFTWEVEQSAAIAAEFVASRAEELQRTIRREMKAVVFLYVPAEDAKWYKEPLKDWDAVVNRWPKMTTNISESSRCFALGRFGGSIFHILLVAEFGVILVGDLLGVSGDKPGWGCVNRLEKILKTEHKDRSLLGQQHSHLLKEIVPMIAAVRDSSRHKISHVDNQLVWLDSDMSPQIASEVISATRGFMRRLAAELPQVP
jgi:hypothetical protein